MEDDTSRPNSADDRDAGRGSNPLQKDLVHPEWGEAPSWFGYIGLGITVASALLAITGMVVFVRLVMGWVAG